MVTMRLGAALNQESPEPSFLPGSLPTGSKCRMKGVASRGLFAVIPGERRITRALRAPCSFLLPG